MAEEQEKQEEIPQEPDVVVKVEPEAPVAAAPDDAVKDLVNQYKQLEARSEKEQKEKEAALARATAAEQAAESARRETAAARAAVNSSNLDTIVTALDKAQGDIDAAKRDIVLAGQAGDFEAQAAAYERLAGAKTLAARYDEAKADLEARRAAPQRQETVDPVEAYVRNRTEPTAKWLREHRDFVVDPRKNAKLTAAHHDALADGLSPDTPEYFTHVEKFIGLRKDTPVAVTDGDNVQRPGAAPAKKQAQRTVAPVNGSGGSGGHVPSNEVRLSAREAVAATDGTHVWNYDDPSGQKKFKRGDPIGVQEFARRKQKLTEQGAYDRTYETQ